MTVDRMTANMRPGDWAIDNSRHKYRCGGIPIVGYEWHACSVAGVVCRGVARDFSEGEARAQAWARSARVA